jgi:hypothetical protein
MDKREFKNSLKYGPCDGSREFLSTKCRGENAGTKEHDCPLSTITARLKDGSKRQNLLDTRKLDMIYSSEETSNDNV